MSEPKKSGFQRFACRNGLKENSNVFSALWGRSRRPAEPSATHSAHASGALVALDQVASGVICPGGFADAILMTELSCHDDRARNTSSSEPRDEYLTDSRIHFDWRLISNMKDAFAYFGFRAVFRRGSNSGAWT
jgi:hypothetical protein